MKTTAIAMVALLISLSSCAYVPEQLQPGHYLSQHQECEVAATIGGMMTASLALFISTWIVDANIDVAKKIRQGEPIPEATVHHTQTANNILLYGGLGAIPIGGFLGYEAGAHYLCKAD